MAFALWADAFVAADGETWTEESRLKNHSDWVRDVAWAQTIGSHAYTLASCDEAGIVCVWKFTPSAANDVS